MSANGSKSAASTLEVVIYSASLAEAAVSVVGNALVVGAVLLCTKLRHKEMTPLVMLAITDGLVGLTKGYQFADYLRRLSIESSKHGAFTAQECFDIWTVAQFAAAQAQGAAMLLLSIDRLLALAFFNFYVALGRGYARMVAASIITYAGFMSGMSVAANRAMPPVAQLAPSCLSVAKFPRWWDSTRSLTPLFGFGSVLVYIFVIVVYLRKPTSSVEVVRRVQLKRQKRLAVTMSLVTAGTIVFYCLPYLASNMVKAVLPRASWKPVLMLVQFFKLTNSSVNVCIYAWRLPEMRKAMGSLLRCKNPNHAATAAVQPQQMALTAPIQHTHRQGASRTASRLRF